MRIYAAGFTAVAVTLASLAVTAPAQAQPNRVFVGGEGSDSDPCTFAAPCRSFQHAHDVVAAHGEIDVLDPAGYGPIVVTKSISIQAHGFGGITAVGPGTGITIQALGSDRVALRGLLLDGANSGEEGIHVTSIGLLSIEDSVIRNFTANGINFSPSASATLVVSNTTISDNLSSGLEIFGTGTQTFVNLVDVRFISNTFANVNYGGNGTGVIWITALDSIFVASPGTGIIGTKGNMLVSNSTISNNGTGANATGDTNPSIRLDRTQVWGNNTAFVGGVATYGPNNASDQSPVFTPLPLQ
jgi:hypothetical protein